MRSYLKILIISLGLALLISPIAMAMDAEKIKEEKRPVIGKILIEFDESVNTESVYIIEAKTGKKIWLEMLREIKGDFKNFLQKASKSGKNVKLTGVVEYWTDGMVMRPSRVVKYEVIK